MPTPRISFSEEEIQSRRNNALLVADAYKYRAVGLVVQIRYEPNLASVTMNDQLVQEYSESGFFLMKLHYEYIMFAQRYFAWGLEMTYEQLLQKLRTIVEDHLGLNDCFILHLTIHGDGTFDVEAELAQRRPNLFLGLLGDFSTNLVPIRATTATESTSMAQNATPITVYIDREPTPASEHTTFRTTYTELYDRALARFAPPDNEEVVQFDYDVLMWNVSQQVLGTTDYSIAVFRANRWYTPHVRTGAPFNPLRQLLLELSVLEERDLSIQMLEIGEPILLISDSEGLLRGRLAGTKPKLLPPRRKRTRKVVKMPRARKRTAIKITEDERLAEEASEKARIAKPNSSSGIPGTFVFRSEPQR